MFVLSEYRLIPHNRTPDLRDPQTKTKVLIKYKKSLRSMYRNLPSTSINNLDSMNLPSSAKD